MTPTVHVVDNKIYLVFKDEIECEAWIQVHSLDFDCKQGISRACFDGYLNAIEI